MLVETAVRRVVRLGDPVLRAAARRLSPAEVRGPDIQRLILEVAATMDEYEGVGIAANQVGEGLSLFLMALNEGSPRHPAGIPVTIVANPEYKPVGEEREDDWEGCLSVPGLRGKVPRFKRVELSGLDENAKPFSRVYEGFPARVVQHETDHLNGKVYLDRMADLTTLAYVARV